jgi:hypothetical protein
VCLGPDHDPALPSGIAVDDDGYATLHNSTAGAVVLQRLDHLGAAR